MGVTGREVSLAFGMVGANSWGVTTSVTRRAYFDADAGLTTIPTYVDDTAFGQAFVGPADVGDFQPADLTLSGQDYYDHYLYMLEAAAMGSPAAVTAVSSQGAATSLVAYQHVIDLAPNTDGRGIVVASDKVLFVEELSNAKVAGFSWSLGTGGVVQKSYRLMGAKSTNSSTINTRSTVAGSALNPTLTNRVFRQQGTVRLNAQAGAALAAADALADVTAATFEFQRPMTPAMVFGQNYTAEPLNDGFPSVRVTLQFRQASTTSTNSFYALAQSGAPLKGEITFSGSISGNNYINSATPRGEKYEFPYLEVVEHTIAASGAGQLTPTVTFVAKKASANPTGMAVSAPFRLTRWTTQSLVAF
jgi:hypothetical protein